MLDNNINTHLTLLEAPVWRQALEYKANVFQKMFGEVDPSMICSVFVEYCFDGQFQEYQVESCHHEAMLWSLNLLVSRDLIKDGYGEKENSARVLLYSDNINPILDSFHEHGDRKRIYLCDERYYPFIHALLNACQSEGALVVKWL